jgi:glycosyltransferase involved in cell wall biosynthesis
MLMPASPIAFCGPLSGVPTGQQAALRAAIDAVARADAIEVDMGGSGLPAYQSVSKVIRGLITLAKALGPGGARTVYVTPSRTLVGVLREFPIVVLARTAGARIIAHWHGAEFHYLRREPTCILARLLRSLWMPADTHVALCETMRDDLRQFGFRDVRVIPNFCKIPDTDVTATQPCGASVRLLYLSNLIPEKGIQAAIGAHRQLANNGHVVELHVIGARLGPLPYEVEQGLRSAGVTYHGPLYGRAKDDVVGMCDVLLFPSVYRSEAFPLVVLEAMCAGLAVVAYRHNYIADFFEPAGGYLVPCNPDALAAATATLVNERARLDAFKAANRQAARAYSTDRYEQRIRDLFASFDAEADDGTPARAGRG